ncbi:hypothetical protein KIN20_033786 [Parelaphostrongylus tenuis]|uniref:Uncharacterized protein n=1 Tax=Parelaphostrongylus tenuis TaxID=148309 RepID=A0AAD5WJ60_PARTN|nr:hypothetical protein KIN20_033786 [Parelaphostrongylus tenuis]
MSTKKRTGSNSKLDEMLRAGASGKHRVVDIHKAISSTTHRLMKEAINFTKQTAFLDNSQQYRNSGFLILESQNESLAKRRIAKLMVAKEKPQFASVKSVQTIDGKKKMNFKKKNRKKAGGKFRTSMSI